jgi:hypothetical protein
MLLSVSEELALEEARILPLTVSFCSGDASPMPTFPALAILIFSVPAVENASSLSAGLKIPVSVSKANEYVGPAGFVLPSET